jgi:4-amino-4-deoxy-L-arabinose transferase-like glycosyltransferase
VTPPRSAPSSARPAVWLALALAITLAGYLYHLGGRNILKIGDEELYIQTARMTAEQGKLLPLLCEQGICNFKPPLLFWQGIFATDWGRWWDLWALRVPTVLYTAATAFLVWLLAARLSADRRKGWLAALLYCATFSTVQYGRPFLTNQPETFWLFLPVVLLLALGELSWPVVGMAGVALGVGTLYKSFVLVLPLTAGFALIQWRRRGRKLLPTLREDAGRLAAMAGIALAVFALWFVFDPYPGRIVSDFILRENVGKFQHGSYLHDLVAGRYNAITVIWLGDFVNFGLLAPALLGLVVVTALSLRTRGSSRGADGRFAPRPAPVEYQSESAVVDAGAGLSPAERDLWCYILGFLIAYSVPRQRQENYILPTVAALSVLLALRWDRIAAGWLRASGLLVAAVIGILDWMILGIPAGVPDVHYAPWQLAVVGLLFALAVSTVIGRGDGIRWRLPAAAAGAWLSLGIALAPFDAPFASAVPGPGMTALHGRTIRFPSTFFMRHERYRFDVPGSQVVPYDPRNPATTDSLVREGALMALLLPLDASAPAGHITYGSRLELRTRIPAAETRQIIFHQRYDLLIQRLDIIEGTSTILGRPGG